MKRHDLLFFDTLVFIIFSLISCVLGIRPLLDPDLGWHVAGGLWMLEHRSVPVHDPFTALGSEWVAYSWLAELLFALVFKYCAFAGLQALQFLLILSSVWLVLSLNRGALEHLFPRDQLGYRLSWVLGSFVVLFFIAPIWHLRPQLLSLLVFLVVLRRAETNQLTPSSILGFGVLWANIHIYWVFLPVLVFLYWVVRPLLRGERAKAVNGVLLTAMSIATGFATPYGLKFFEVISAYAVNHTVAAGLIAEFQPLNRTLGLIFFLFLGVLVVLFSTCHSWLTVEEVPLFLLGTTFGCLCVEQWKFLPLFGVVAGVLLARRGIPTILNSVRDSREEIMNMSQRRLSLCNRTVLVAFIVVFSAVCGFLFKLPEALPSRTAELMEIVRKITEDSTTSLLQQPHPLRVLNHFDQGGWLALFFWLNRKSHRSDLSFVTTIDGRTLVMGPSRLTDFDQLRRGERGWCEIIDRWGAELAILPKELPVTEALRAHRWPDRPEDSPSCKRVWRVILEAEHWVVFGSEMNPVAPLERG